MIAWDSNAKRKKEMFVDYKANRAHIQIPDQISDLRLVFSSVNVIQYECPGEEADDVIATLTESRKNEGQVYIYSGDKDMMQLVENGKVTLMRPKHGANPEKYYNEEAVMNEFGVSPKDLTCYLAFRGDTVDNIPGVPRMKSSSISSLVQKYNSPSNIYANIANEQMTDFQRESLKNFESQSYINLELVKLKRDLVMNEYAGHPDPEAVKDILDKYEIKSIKEESYVRIFDANTQFLKRTSVENYSLF
jgi:5'-3' exonuclease